MAKAKKAKKLTVKQRSEAARKGWRTRRMMGLARRMMKENAIG
jgi:hypothetical protein